MPFRPEQFAVARPYLYHLTFRANLPRIRATRTLETAAHAFVAAGRADLLRSRRPKHVELRLPDGTRLYVRDQAPLHEKNVEFTDGWTFADLVEHLNHRVYFWPGTDRGPIDYGQRHFERYRSEQPIIIRTSFTSICHANPDRAPLFCAFNSGSPRFSAGRASPRGPTTFAPADVFPKGPGEVIEVTFDAAVRLPPNADVMDTSEGEWSALFPQVS